MSFLVKAVRGVTKSIPLVSDVVEFVTEPVKIVTEVVEDVVTSVPVVGDVLKPVLAVGDNTAQLVTHWASAVDGGVDVNKGNHRNHSEFYVVGCAIQSWTPAMHVGLVARRDGSWLCIQKLQSGDNECSEHKSYDEAANRIKEHGRGKGTRPLQRLRFRGSDAWPSLRQVEDWCRRYNHKYNLANNNCQHFVNAFIRSFAK